MFGFFGKKNQAAQVHDPKISPSAKLDLFAARHPVDKTYYDDLVSGVKASGPALDELERMCRAVEVSIGPLQVVAALRKNFGTPSDTKVVGYLFGWLDVAKTHTWQVPDFNRSFFHYGFYLWFGAPYIPQGQQKRDEDAMSAMTRLGICISTSDREFLNAARVGTKEAIETFRDGKVPKGPTPTR